MIYQFQPKENIYGHKKRLEWIESKLNINDKILEFGCGTGIMISLPLAEKGYLIEGLDLDEKSINLGKEIALKSGTPVNFICDNLHNVNKKYDCIIASEVLEHLSDADLNEVLSLIHASLNENGRLLVTVPNGYGWFELEAFIYDKIKVGVMLEYARITSVIFFLKKLFLGYNDSKYPSTLSNSPHIQRFTRRKISKMLKDNNFKICSIEGSTLIAGKFSNLIFSGNKFIMNINNRLGLKYPIFASGFYIEAIVRET